MNVKELCKKLKALADHGIDGEKVNAAAMLKKVLKKYGLTEQDLIELIEEKTEIKFKLSPDFPQLLIQIIGHVCGSKTKMYPSVNKKWRYVSVTEREKIEIEFLHATYIAAYKKQKKLFQDAFIHTNKIYPRDASISLDEVTPEELKRYREIQNMSQGINKTIVQKQLN